MTARPKPPPTIRQRRLGAELRRLRERAELSATQAGELLGVSQSRVSNIESGGYAVSADRVRTMARTYGCADQPFVDALAGMTGGRTRGWWDEYREILPRGSLDLAEVEHHAEAIRLGTVIHMPGLLQTAAHARALMSHIVPALPPHEVEHRVSHRLKRQAILYADTPTPVTAIVHEAALHMGFGGAEVAKAQLEHLLDMSELPHIHLVVVPFGTSTFPSSGQGIIYYEGEVPRLDTVQIDTDHGPSFLDTEPHLLKYRQIVDRMEACAVEPSAAREVIHKVARSF
ncbi:helix-turn-helix transcriptional regulator [Streptomyces sodiiphilus]|uniref:Helix-turn-helix transcriptional regulator n=1 Tax=Streptomyces sodiiphilus TaxID=226217 RepID=A0ABP5AIT6_9ACTN